MDGLNLVITITDREKTETAIKLFQHGFTSSFRSIFQAIA